MGLNPLSEYVSGIKSIAFKLFGKKTDGSYEAIKTNDNGALKVDGVVTLSGSIPEFGWVDGDAEPTPTEFSFGAKVNPATGEITTMYWDGTAWEEMR